jgi:hypothetical protein
LDSFWAWQLAAQHLGVSSRAKNNLKMEIMFLLIAALLNFIPANAVSNTNLVLY